MKPLSILSLGSLSALLLTTTACQKSEPAEKAQVQKVENMNASQPAIPAPIPVPTIAPGTWVGTMADGTDAAMLTIIPGNRITIVQQDVPTNGSYIIDPSTSPATFNFTPDNQGQGYSSQVQWLDENTITMTSFVPSVTSAAAPMQPVAPAPQPAAQAQPAPFTGNVPPPASYTAPTATPTQAAEPSMSDVIVTVTFHRQQPSATPAAAAVSP